MVSTGLYTKRPIEHFLEILEISTVQQGLTTNSLMEINMSKGITIGRYLIHSALSSYGVVLITFIVEMLVGLIIGPQNSFLDYAFFGPTFLVPILTGLAFGYLFGGRLPRWSSRLVFVIPLMIAAYEIWMWVKYSYSGEVLLASIKDNFVGANCGGS
jgi:hypothetical protein